MAIELPPTSGGSRWRLVNQQGMAWSSQGIGLAQRHTACLLIDQDRNGENIRLYKDCPNAETRNNVHKGKKTYIRCAVCVMSKSTGSTLASGSFCWTPLL